MHRIPKLRLYIRILHQESIRKIRLEARSTQLCFKTLTLPIRDTLMLFRLRDLATVKSIAEKAGMELASSSSSSARRALASSISRKTYIEVRKTGQSIRIRSRMPVTSDGKSGEAQNCWAEAWESIRPAIEGVLYFIQKVRR